MISNSSPLINTDEAAVRWARYALLTSSQRLMGSADITGDTASVVPRARHAELGARPLLTIVVQKWVLFRLRISSRGDFSGIVTARWHGVTLARQAS